MTATGLFRGIVLSLVVCAACAGKSTVHHAGRSDAGADPPPDAPPDAPDAPDAPEQPAVCASTSIRFGRPPNEFLFAVPRSAAMGTPLSTDDGRTRLEATTASLSAALEKLAPETIVGLVFTPYEDACAGFHYVPQAPLNEGDQLERLKQALSDTSPSAERSSVTTALDASIGLSDLGRATNRAIVVFLDMATPPSAGCSDEPTELDLLIDDVRRMSELGDADTYFIASPNSGAGEQACVLAEAGGCASCCDDFSNEPAFDQRLVDLVEPIVSFAYSCEFPLPESPEGAPLDLETFTMTAFYEDGATEAFPRVLECGDRPGFTLSELQDRLLLCPATCLALTGTARGTLEITVACTDPTDPPEPLDAGDDSGPIPRLCARSASTPADDSCALPLPVTPEGSRLDLASVTVTLEDADGASTPLPRRVECGDEAGFTIVEGPLVVLCRATCTDARAADLTVTVGVCLRH